MHSTSSAKTTIISYLIVGSFLPFVAPHAEAQSTRTLDQGVKAGKVFLLPATIDTTQWGVFNNAQHPVLTIDSGDTVVMETMMHAHNQVVPGRTIEEITKLRMDYKRTFHTLTGPVYVNGAGPGDVLKVTINKIIPRAYAADIILPGLLGQFPKEFPVGQVKYVYLDTDRQIAEWVPGVNLPLRPFPGVIAVARKEPGEYGSAPPGNFGGNLDLRDMVVGTSVYLPVFVQGALLWSGDSHAAQGNGEVHGGALETAFKELNLTVEVIKGKSLDMPQVETATSWITIGLGENLDKAWDQAVAETAKVLSAQRGISLEQAAKLSTTVSDCRVTQIANPIQGIHCLNPKQIDHKEDLERPTAETSENYVTYAKDVSMNKAIDTASWNMIKLLENKKNLSPLDAYGLVSLAMDCRIGTVSSAERTIHCLLPKSLWQQ
jgi:acetamidase/formamidase